MDIGIEDKYLNDKMILIQRKLKEKGGGFDPTILSNIVGLEKTLAKDHDDESDDDDAL